MNSNRKEVIDIRLVVTENMSAEQLCENRSRIEEAFGKDVVFLPNYKMNREISERIVVNNIQSCVVLKVTMLKHAVLEQQVQLAIKGLVKQGMIYPVVNAPMAA